MGEKRQKGKNKKRRRKYHHTPLEDTRWLKAIERLDRRQKNPPP